MQLTETLSNSPIIITGDLVLVLQILGAVAFLGLLIYFLQSIGKWEINVPWPVRTYTRILVLLVFMWITLHIAGYTLGAENDARMELFSTSIKVVADLTKTLVGAIIGALSATGLFTKGDGENLPPENNSDKNLPEG